MRTLIKSMIISMLLMFSAPAWSNVIHILTCDQDEEITDDQVEAATAEWLAAAKKVEGGENMKLFLEFPIAAQAEDVDFAIIVSTPNFSEWGAFMDNYHGSAAEDIDDKYEDDFDCGDGTLWESIEIE